MTPDPTDAGPDEGDKIIQPDRCRNCGGALPSVFNYCPMGEAGSACVGATPPDDAPVPAPVPSDPAPEASAAPAPEPKKVPAMTLEEMRKFEPTKDVVAGLEAQLADLTVQKDAMRDSREHWKRESGRANTEAADAKQLHERYQRALRLTEGELREAEIILPRRSLVDEPAELPNLIRRLGKVVKSLSPNLKGLRDEVTRLNSVVVDRNRAAVAADETISQLRKDLDAGKRREEQLEALTPSMQKSRDTAHADRDHAIAEKEKAERALAQARAKIAEHEGTIARLQTSARQAVHAS